MASCGERSLADRIANADSTEFWVHDPPTFVGGHRAHERVGDELGVSFQRATQAQRHIDDVSCPEADVGGMAGEDGFESHDRDLRFGKRAAHDGHL